MSLNVRKRCLACCIAWCILLSNSNTERWEKLDGIIATRILHNPLGSFKYKKKPTVPEIGICLEILNHMAISRLGEVSICVRFDPAK